MSSGTSTSTYTAGGADDPANPFHYMPSMAAAIIALVFYALTFIILLFWTIWKRSWYMIPLLLGCIMEVIGYGARIPLAITPVGQLSLYTCMSVCIIIAPVFNAAVQYLLLGRLMHAVGDHYSLIKPQLVAWIFIICDIFSLLVQSSGAGLLSAARTNIDTAKTGENILIAGLAINLLSFVIFCFQLFYFDYKTRKSPPNFPSGGLCQKGWRQFLYVLYLTSFLLLIRQIYRVIEFAQGFTGYLAAHEVYFYIFDTLLIFFAYIAYGIIFPGNGYLPPNRNDTFATLENTYQNPRKVSSLPVNTP